MTTNVRFSGRIVWGHPTNPKGKVDQKTKQPVLKDGVQVQQRAFGVAVPSAQFAATVWPVMAAEAMKHFPGGQFPGDYAWKFKDSNSYDKGDLTKGRQPKLYSEREGWAGCHVITISSELLDPVTCYQNVNGAWVAIDGASIKCGDYVEVNADIDAHLGQSPGLYINPKGVLLIGIGDAIVTGANPDEMFAGGPAPLPTGAAPPPMPGGFSGGAPGAPASPLPLPAAAPVVAPPPAPLAPPAIPGQPPAIVSPTSPPLPGAPLAPPVNGFAAGTPVMPGQVAPPPVAAPPPPAAPVRTPAGYHEGKPYYINPVTNQTEW